MKWNRRGFRRGTRINPKEQATPKKDETKKMLPVDWEAFYETITPLLRPEWKGEPKRFSAMYQGINEEDQKKLTHKIAGQILFAHSDVVKELLARLSNISLDLGQQTEVTYRRLCLVDKFF